MHRRIRWKRQGEPRECRAVECALGLSARKCAVLLVVKVEWFAVLVVEEYEILAIK